ncbi:nucleotide sugar dehydrogenase [Fluviicoccus keumensis]|uniref:nucleotide sugar dehydrogenase n=1 Tax=Fluviicoccus keumensis TaxID=1435465 RepID=UPI001A92F778|nr:nucleotide sugar dehydrogenase [Fluviicoccus keumensis]
MNFNGTVAIVGLGYVGLPLALAFGRKVPTIGFDIHPGKIRAYLDAHDPSGEVTPDEFRSATQITYTTSANRLAEADYIIVAVPTPIDNAKQPDLTPVVSATRAIGPHLKKGAIVIYESTVYPGVTEDICGPILEETSGLVRGVDFWLGYSPERINPGDKIHRLDNITKIVSGENPDILEKVSTLYRLVVDVGVYQASSIKVAEAAKVVENTQRDVNIALINELAVIFNLMEIDTLEVLEAAGTKWNFLPFRPGLVGGHCIGVDPYYLTHKVQTLGYKPEVILASRTINDRMGSYIAQQAIKQMILADRMSRGATVLIMGLTFKENCSDIRNTRVTDIIQELKDYGLNVAVWDPVANAEETVHEYGLTLTTPEQVPQIDAVIAAVGHDCFRNMDLSVFRPDPARPLPFLDVKSRYDAARLTALGFRVWRL